MAEISYNKAIIKDINDDYKHYFFGVKGSLIGIWDWNVTADQMYCCSFSKKILNLEKDNVLKGPQDWLKYIHPEDISKLKDLFDFYTSRIDIPFKSQFRIRNKNGLWHSIIIQGKTTFDLMKNYLRISGILIPLEINTVLKTDLFYDAFYDPLTNLTNRSLFLDRLKYLFLQRPKNTERMALFFIDIDYFKSINDQHGHTFGDLIIQNVARRLKKLCRPQDTLCRYGGDEFTLLMHPITSQLEAEILGQRIYTHFKKPIIIDNVDYFVTLSIGIALAQPHHENVEEMIHESDMALYQAKLAGRNQYKVFHTKMHHTVLQKTQLEYTLEKALELDQIKIFFIPIAHLQNQKIAGFEVILRWQHPLYHTILPISFLAVNSFQDAYCELNKFLIEKACQSLILFQKSYNFTPFEFLSLNFSDHQLECESLGPQMHSILQKFDLNFKEIAIEISDKYFKESSSQGYKNVKFLHQSGIQINLNTTGFQIMSLESLISQPFNGLKIDRELTSTLHKDLSSPINPLIKLAEIAKILDVKLILEGIESISLFEKVKSLNFEYGQGYFFSKPLRSDEVISYLKSHVF